MCTVFYIGSSDLYSVCGVSASGSSTIMITWLGNTPRPLDMIATPSLALPAAPHGILLLRSRLCFDDETNLQLEHTHARDVAHCHLRARQDLLAIHKSEVARSVRRPGPSQSACVAFGLTSFFLAFAQQQDAFTQHTVDRRRNTIRDAW